MALGRCSFIIATKAMNKDYDAWNEKKKKLDSLITAPNYHEREVWWCSLGLNIGFEQDGKSEDFSRPIVVIKAYNRNLLLAVPLIGKKKEGVYYKYLGYIVDRDASAVLSQARPIDSKRLIRKTGRIDGTMFYELTDTLQKSLFGRKIVCPCVCRGEPEGIYRINIIKMSPASQA